MKLSVFSKNDGDFKSTVKTEDAYGIKSFERKYALIINQGRVFFEYVKSLFVGSVGFASLANGSDCELCGQAIGLPYISIAQMVKANLSEGLIFPCNLRNVIASFIEDFHCFNQGSLLLGCR